MKMQDVNNLSSEEFIESFNNIFENTSSIAISSEKKRPFNNKNGKRLGRSLSLIHI